VLSIILTVTLGVADVLAEEYLPERFGVSPGETGSNNQAHLARLLASVPPGGKIKFSPGTYSVTGLWTIAKPCTIEGHGAILNFLTDAPDQGMRVTASNITIKGLTIQGPQYTATQYSQMGLYVYGAGKDNYVRNINIMDCTIHNWSAYGLQLRFVDGFTVSGCKVYNCYHTGIGALSVQHGVIRANRVENITAPLSVTHAYGIIISKNNGDAITYPISRQVRVTDNYVKGVKDWEGIDTHAGSGVVIARNTVIDCLTGIIVGRYDHQGLIISPYNCEITENKITNESIPQTGIRYGICSVGDYNYPAKYGNNIIIANNTVTGYGRTNGNEGTGAAIYSYAINNLSINGNMVRKAGTMGISIDYIGADLNIRNNSIQNIVGASGYGVYLRKRSGGAITGQVADNTIDVPGHIGIYAKNACTDIRFINNKLGNGTRALQCE
jgi:hypothetical protein